MDAGMDLDWHLTNGFKFYYAFQNHKNNEIKKPTDDSVFRCRQSS